MKVDEFIVAVVEQVRAGVRRAQDDGVLDDEPHAIEFELAVVPDDEGPPRVAGPGDGESCSIVTFSVSLGGGDDDFGGLGEF